MIIQCVANLPILYLSTAVVSTPEDNRGPSWYITIVSGVVVLLVVVSLCVHAPCGCLWRRHRNEHDVSCPIAGSNKGMCGKCFLHNSTTTKTMTYKERPHHVSVTMASNDGYHRQSSGEYSSQVKTFVQINFKYGLTKSVHFNETKLNLVELSDVLFKNFQRHSGL